MKHILGKTKTGRILAGIILLLTALLPSPAYSSAGLPEPNPLYEENGRIMDYTFTKVKKSKDKALNYSGKTVMWQGEILRKIDNDAYFIYVLKLDSGDEIKVLSGRGIPQKPGDYVKVKGMILIREGQFSHLVLNEIQNAIKQVKRNPYLNENLMATNRTNHRQTFARIYQWILYYNGGISDRNARFIADRIVYYAGIHRQDPYMITALMSAESAFNMGALSPVGAIGLGQLMPGTASSLGVNPYDPEQNIEGCIRYLRYQMQRWNSFALALASYNAGPGAVIKYGGIPPYRETIDYVSYVTAIYGKIRNWRCR